MTSLHEDLAKLLSSAIVFFEIGKGGFAHLNNLQKSHAKVFLFEICFA